MENINRQKYEQKRIISIMKLSPATVSKMGREEFVSMEVLYRIGNKLNVDFGEIVSIINDKNK